MSKISWSPTKLCSHNKLTQNIVCINYPLLTFVFWQVYDYIKFKAILIFGKTNQRIKLVYNESGEECMKRNGFISSKEPGAEGLIIKLRIDSAILISLSQSSYPSSLMSKDEKRVAHKKITVALPDDTDIQIDSNFDSGNLESASLISMTQTEPDETVKIEFTPASEPFNPQYSSKCSNKTFFHFSVKSPKPIVLHALIKRMEILGIIENSFDEYYQICVGFKKSSYKEPEYTKFKPQYMHFIKVGQEQYLEFKYNLKANQTTFFAYHFPYSVERLRKFLEDMSEQVKNINSNRSDCNTEIYFKNQRLIQSLESRPINLVTITEMTKGQENNLVREPRISKSLFPYFDLEERPFKFQKPYIMISCRVHPGETSASFALEGFIKKILSSHSQSEFLRKGFVFIIVPMLNPDGVFHGTYRMDTQGHNLNRFYNGCVAHRQPSIFAVQALIQHHSEDIVGYFDIHSHPALKGSFFYGNAFPTIREQAQSQLFAKLLSYNSETFIYQYCTFSQKNMNSKDINDLLTKDGSARVCAFKKMPSAIHCYTLQMGYHGYPVKKEPTVACPFKSQYRRTNIYFDLEDYAQEGIALANTIAQIYIQNFRQSNANENALGQSNESLIASLREEIGRQIYEKEERFRMMDGGLIKKIKTIHKEVYSNFYDKLYRRFPVLEESIRSYENRLFRQKYQGINDEESYYRHMRENGFKPIHSLELIKSMRRKEQQSATFQRKYPQEDELNFVKNTFGVIKNARGKIPQNKDIARLIKSKVNITPVQFTMPEQSNKRTRRGISGGGSNKDYNMNHLLNLHLDSLPKIEKKKLKVISDNNRALRGKRISSSLNSQKNIDMHDVDLNFKKMTIQNQLDVILDAEDKINHKFEPEEEQKQDFQDYFIGQARFRHHPPKSCRPHQLNMGQLEEQEVDQEIEEEQTEVVRQKNFNEMNFLHNNGMYKKQRMNKHTEAQADFMKNYQTERLHRKLIASKRGQSDSRNKPMRGSKKEKDANLLPKLEGKPEKIRTRFDFELKIKEKYDKEYLIEEK